ncbi:MAG TPA: hypothetical protein VFJ80_13020 [Candidatus Limnocylindrales bacterium]|nr:hypothetical protein [Candidatus Limnocylindrales bacterium]
MIELLLEAERALSFRLIDRAEQLYRQVAAADPQNSIAVVGLARVALERSDDLGAYLLARRALGIDPENEAARRLAVRLEEVLATRGQPVADPLPAGSAARSSGASPAAATPATSESETPPPVSPMPSAPSTAIPDATPEPTPNPAAYRPKRSLMDRLRRRRR